MRHVSRARTTAATVAMIMVASLLSVAAPAAASAGDGARLAEIIRTDANRPSGSAPALGFVPDLRPAPSAAVTQFAAPTADVVTGGTVTGKISATAPFEEGIVVLMQPDEASGYYRWDLSDIGIYTGPDGSFTLTDVPPGTYSAAFGAYGDTEFAPQYFDRTDNLSLAKSFTVTAGGTVTGVDASLVAGAAVSGKVVNALGKPLAGALVQIARKITVDGKPFWEYYEQVTDAAGLYSETGFAAGQYAVRVEGPQGQGYSPAFYGGGTSFDTSKSFPVSAGKTQTGINVTLTKKLTVGTPKITGTAAVGSTLKAVPGTWTKGTTFRYQWFANGKAISKATKSTFTITASQKAKKITVRVTGANPTYATGVKTSKATAQVATTATPKISGTVKVGKKLTAKPGVWTKGTKFSYQWYANGTAISKANKATLTLARSHKGKKITVKVTGKKSGYATVAKVSKATKKVG